MKLSIIGTGNVGLVTGACFSAQGHEVRCADIDTDKIDRLQRLELHSEEPGLADLVARNVEAGRLTFTTDTPAAVACSEAVFLCVETPQGEDGKPDLEQILAATQTVAESIEGFTLIVVKSTVPVGTTETLRRLISSSTGEPFTIACNPEFLKAGSAVRDFRQPDRVVAGCPWRASANSSEPTRATSPAASGWIRESAPGLSPPPPATAARACPRTSAP